MQIAWSGIGIVEGIGLIGGTQFSRNRSGNTASSKTVPRVPGTISQQAVMTNYRTVLQAWRSLDDTDRREWDNTAGDPFVTRKNRVGVDYQPTGQSLFVECNLNAYNFSYPISTPAAFPTWTAIYATSLEVLVSGKVELTMSAAGIGTTEAIVVFATAPVSAGQMSQKQPNYLKLVTLPQGEVSDPIQLYDQYILLLGEPVVGQKIFIKCQLLDTVGGYKTEIGTVSAIATS